MATPEQPVEGAPATAPANPAGITQPPVSVWSPVLAYVTNMVNTVPGLLPMLMDNTPTECLGLIYTSYNAGVSQGLGLINPIAPFIPGNTDAIGQQVQWLYFRHGSAFGMNTRIANLQTTASTVPSTSSNKAPKLRDPPVFTGKYSEFKDFATACREHFATDPVRYDTDDKKIVFMASHLYGPPRN